MLAHGLSLTLSKINIVVLIKIQTTISMLVGDYKVEMRSVEKYLIGVLDRREAFADRFGVDR